jgi:Tuberculosis necrotizing toxin
VNYTDPSGFVAEGLGYFASNPSFTGGGADALSGSGADALSGAAGPIAGILGAGGNVVTSLAMGLPGGARPGGSYSVTPSATANSSAVTPQTVQAKGQNRVGLLAPPDLSVPEFARGPDLRLADNSDDPEILPGQACMAEHCRTMSPLVVLGVVGDLLSEVANVVDSIRKLWRNEPTWPPNRGFSGTPTSTTLAPGTRIDRYGSELGTFASPSGTPFGARSLPPGAATAPLRGYEVLKPLPAQGGPVAPWFGQPGGGIQYEFAQSIQSLMKQGFLRRLP